MNPQMGKKRSLGHFVTVWDSYDSNGRIKIKNFVLLIQKNKAPLTTLTKKIKAVFFENLEFEDRNVSTNFTLFGAFGLSGF